MQIRKLDGSSIIEIDERDLWVAKNAKQRMLGRRCK